MDYGALALKDISNPNRKSERYARQSKFIGSKRQARSTILQYIIKKEGGVRLPNIVKILRKDQGLQTHVRKAGSILEELRREGFLSFRGGFWRVREN